VVGLFGVLGRWFGVIVDIPEEVVQFPVQFHVHIHGDFNSMLRFDGVASWQEQSKGEKAKDSFHRSGKFRLVREFQPNGN
jgi:hypothetical protein